MAKTRQRSKRNARAKRQARSKAARTSRREAQADREAARRLDDMFDYGTSAQHAAELIRQRLGGGAMWSGTAELFVHESSADRAKEVSSALAALAPDSLEALTLAADVARRIEHDDRRASALIDRALELTDDEGQVPIFANHLVLLGRAAEALELIDPIVTEQPEDEGVQEIRAAALALAHRRMASDPSEELLSADCPCWSGHPWAECCRPAEDSALARFNDQAPLDRLRAAVARFVDSTPNLRAAVAEHVASWVSETDAGLERVAAEHGWLVGLEDEEGGGTFDVTAPLARFALDPATPSPFAAAAQRWLEHCNYGLWQLSEPVGSPGVRLTELVTGATRYASLPADLLDRAPRWSVLVGPLVAIDGTWRSGAGMLVLRPREGDAAADLVQELMYAVLSSASGEKLARTRGRGESIEPHGVLARITEPAEPAVADFVSKVIGSGMPQLAGLITELRDAAPQLVNTDKHPMCLIKATVAVDDAARVLESLGQRPDFDVEDDGLKWWGRELDPLELETSVAEVKAMLRERGEPAELPALDGPQRWLRGSLSLDADGHIEVDVNSRERLEMLLGLLSDHGGGPEIIKQLVIDPAQDMAPLRLDSTIPVHASAEAKEAWLRHWPDQQLPALRGLTPHRAARTKHARPLLEALLRELEHDADRLARAGQPAPDIEHLRAELDMPVTAFT